MPCTIIVVVFFHIQLMLFLHFVVNPIVQYNKVALLLSSSQEIPRGVGKSERSG